MTVAVFDIGKTNLKLCLIDESGKRMAERQRPNRSLPGPPWRHFDLEAIEEWLLASLIELGRDHPIAAFVAASHGSGGVLVDEVGAVLPAIDYESSVPADVAAEYATLVPPFPACGAPIQRQAGHFAQQLLVMERAFPGEFAKARHFLPLPQYWAWRLTGRPVHEPTMLGAQSHLVNPLDRTSTGIVEKSGWQRLMPEMVGSATVVGTARPGLTLPADIQVLAGIHDSTANLFWYQAAGLDDFALLSTGTWLVGMSPATPIDALDETFGMTVTSDVEGRPVAGVLAMAGREYAAITGGAAGRTDDAVLAAIIERGIHALPGFVDYDGVFPKSAGRGQIVGYLESHAERIALATLYSALVADVCLDLLRSTKTVVIDGGFAADPAFAILIAALRPGQEVLVNHDGGGTAVGAALLWRVRHRGASAGLSVARVPPSAVPGLATYRTNWRKAVAKHIDRPLPPSCSALSSIDEE